MLRFEKVNGVRFVKKHVRGVGKGLGKKVYKMKCGWGVVKSTTTLGIGLDQMDNPRTGLR